MYNKYDIITLHYKIYYYLVLLTVQKIAVFHHCEYYMNNDKGVDLCHNFQHSFKMGFTIDDSGALQ